LETRRGEKDQVLPKRAFQVTEGKEGPKGGHNERGWTLKGVFWKGLPEKKKKRARPTIKRKEGKVHRKKKGSGEVK